MYSSCLIIIGLEIEGCNTIHGGDLIAKMKSMFKDDQMRN